MTTWFLILTILRATDGGTSIETLEFRRHENCIVAAKTWMIAVNTSRNGFTDRISAICVRHDP